MDKVAFLGTGLMGEPMALRLVEAGHSVFVFNRTKSRTDSLKERGAVVVESPGEAVINGDLTVLMLSDYSAIREVLFLGDSIRTGSKAFIQMGTISSSESLELKKTLESMDKEYMEAPVLGSIPQAKAGTLFVLFGGTEKQFGRWKGLLKNLGNR